MRAPIRCATSQWPARIGTLTWIASARPCCTACLQLVGRQVGEDAGEGADEDRPELGMAAEVGDREVLAECDLVAEGGGEQVGVGVAADVAQDRLVIDLAPLGGVEAQRRGEPHREHARAKREIPRLAGGEVGGIGEHHHEVGASNRDVSHAHAPPQRPSMTPKIPSRQASAAPAAEIRGA